MDFKKKRRVILFFGRRKQLPLSKYQEMAVVYDELWKEADEIVRKFDPCKIKHGRCLEGFSCCQGCEFLSKSGCREKSLACKLWLCPTAREMNPECALLLDELEKNAKSHAFIPLEERSIKEDILCFYDIIEG